MPTSHRAGPGLRSCAALTCLLGSGLAWLAGCGSAELAEPEVWHGQHHRAEEAACERLADAEAWREAWRRVGEAPPRAWPGGEAVAVVMLDRQRPSGGHRPVLEGVTDGTAAIRVEAPEGPATTVITRPWLVALYPDGGPREVTCRGP